MKPVQIFLVFLVTLILLLALSYFFPSEGIDGLGRITLRFPTFQDFVKPSEDSSIADITHILEYSEVLGDESTDSISAPVPDSLFEVIDTNRQHTITEPVYPTYSPDSLKKLVYPIAFPQDNPGVIYPFFEQLDHIHEMEHSVRVLHYGDSQIEGDRITSYIRQKLQEEFGGYGPGLFSPLMVVNHTLSIKQSTSSNWKRFGMKDVRNSLIDHNRLGVMMNYGRFVFPDPEVESELLIHDAEIEIEPSGLGYDRVNRFDQIVLYYGFNQHQVHMEIRESDVVIHSDSLPPNQLLQRLSIPHKGSLDHMIISFQGFDSPEIYGISLESQVGIMVDNIPMRGSSGLDFTQSDTTVLRMMLEKMHTGLILLEFGVNIAPNIVKGYTWYENRLYQQLVLLKSLKSDLPVLVLGISDLSRKVDGSFQSYPNIKAIRNAQKNAAFRAGCAFWDTFEAMGGENSMPGWVFADPPLARSDFVHFSNLGSKVIGEMFYNALIHEYRIYRTNHKRNPKPED